MKPINADEKGCNPISSDCVIWQGPDIECINLCKGDTVSDVVYKLATELCNLIETFNLDNYELACLNLGDCAPEDFQSLLQILIERICECCDVDPATPTNGAGCPDCVVNIAECFYYENPQGDTETTMQLTDYVTTVGNSLCNLIGQINTINQTLNNHENRIQALEQAPDPVLDLPQISPVCVINPGIATDMDVVLAALETQFCELIGATGSPIDIFAAIATQCNGLADSQQLAGQGTMSSLPGWSLTQDNLAAALNNIWLTICDVRAAIQNIQASCCAGLCDDVAVAMFAQLTDPNNLNLRFTGSVPPGFSEVGGATLFTITDGYGSNMQVSVPVLANLNNVNGFDVDLLGSPLNTATDLTITASNFTVEDAAGTQCQRVLSYVVTNTVDCPVISATPGEDTVGYSFAWAGAAANLTVELWDGTQTAVLSSQVTAVGGPSPVSGSFSGLSSGTQYYIRLVITAGESTTNCPFIPVTTTAAPCLPATGLTANLVII